MIKTPIKSGFLRAVSIFQPFYGAPWGIRTLDLLLRRQLLYPTELRVLMFTSGIIPYIDCFVKPDSGVFIKNRIKNIEIY